VPKEELSNIVALVGLLEETLTLLELAGRLSFDPFVVDDALLVFLTPHEGSHELKPFWLRPRALGDDFELPELFGRLVVAGNP
jgi:hypothetical protein